MFVQTTSRPHHKTRHCSLSSEEVGHASFSVIAVYGANNTTRRSTQETGRFAAFPSRAEDLHITKAACIQVVKSISTVY